MGPVHCFTKTLKSYKLDVHFICGGKLLKGLSPSYLNDSKSNVPTKCMIRFWNRLINMENSRHTKQIFNWDYECKTGWSKELENLFNELNLEEYFIHSKICSLDSALNKIKISSEKWVEELASKPILRTYVTYKTKFGLESYISSNMSRQRRSLMAQFRFGILPITVETGRLRNIPLQDRRCTICDLNEVDDEKHMSCL